MAKSQQTFNKKDLEKRRLQKRLEKEQRKEERKANAKDGRNLDDMIAYMDENGNITSSPPDPAKKKVIKQEDIVIGSRNIGQAYTGPVESSGVVLFFDTTKGFGFIKETETDESIFVHNNGLLTSIKEKDRVTFEKERGPKGMIAIKVKLAKQG